MTFSLLLICVVIFFISMKNLRERVQNLQRELAEVKKDLLSLKTNLKSPTSIMSAPESHRSVEQKEVASSESSRSAAASIEQATTTSSADANHSKMESNKAKNRRVYNVDSSWSFRDLFGGTGFFQSEFVKNMEQQFAGNLTGLLGTLAVVLGVVFLGVYAGIQLDAIGRFGVVCGFSFAFIGLYVFLAQKTFWKNLSLWSRSAAGVIFLMGCLGSVGVEAMRWIYDPILSLGMLSLGLTVHLVFGFLNGGQVFASIHVLLSLFALAVLPFSTPLFAIATLVSVTGILFSFGNRNWNRHLLLTSLGYFALHLYWMEKDGFEHGRSLVSPIWGILFSLSVGLVGLANHYFHLHRLAKGQTAKGLQGLAGVVGQTEVNEESAIHSSLHWPLLSHLGVWLTMGVNLFLHSEGSSWSSLFLALAALLSFGMSTVTRQWLAACRPEGKALLEQTIGRLPMGWLYICDRLVSLTLILLMIVSLKKFGFSGFELLLFASIASTLFLRLVAQKIEPWVFVVSNLICLLAHMGGVVFVLILGTQAPSFAVLSLLFCSYLILVFVFPFVDKQAQSNRLGLNQISLLPASVSSSHILRQWPDLSVTGLEVMMAMYPLIALILTVASALFHGPGDMQSIWWLLVPAGIFANNLYVKSKFHNLVFDIAVLLFSSLTVLYIVGFCLVAEFSVPTLFSFTLCLGTAGLSCLGYHFRFLTGLKRSVTWPSVAWLWLVLMTMSFQFTKQISPVIPGLLWLLLSVIACELKDLAFFNRSHPLEKSVDSTGVFLGFAGIASLLSFVLRFLLVDMANEVLVLETMRLRVFSEVLCLGVVVHWLLFGRDIKKNYLVGGTEPPLMNSEGAGLTETNSRVSRISGRWYGYLADHFLELFLSLMVFFVAVEFNSIYYPVVWSLGSLGCFLFAKRTSFRRLSLYAYAFYVLALFNIAFSSTTIATPSSLLLDQAWVFGLFSVGICTALMVIQRRYKESTEQIDLGLPYLMRWVNRLWTLRQKFEVRALLYPLFISIACFLYWSFDKSVLSLLWVIECFVLFLISLVMREPQFRVVSMVGIAGICVRILFYDLTGQDFLVKALVFISVGLILIAMNTIYNRYKHRFENEAGLQ